MYHLFVTICSIRCVFQLTFAIYSLLYMKLCVYIDLSCLF